VDGQNVAVEVDGSHHYTNSVPRVPLSEVVLRRRMLQDRGWKVVNVGYMEWEALPQDASTKASALLQLLSTQLGPADSWQRVGPPSRAPGSLVADAEAAQAAAAAEQRQQLLHQQRDMLLHGWGAPGSGFVPAGQAAAAAGFDLGAGVGNQASWGAAVNNAAVNSSAGFSAWGQAQESLGLLSMPAGLGAWGSGALTAGGTGLDASGPSLLQQLTQLQQQLQQQQAWDAFMAAEGAAAAGAGRAEGVASCAADGAASLPPSPASGVQQEGSAAAEAAGPDALPGAEELRTALAAAQQRWNSSPSSTQGSGGSGSGRKAAAFMWGDPTLASIWA
jgi:hypothetical protein